MSEKPVIFISHSHSDKDDALLIKRLLVEGTKHFNQQYSLNFEPLIFVSSSPNAIGVGQDWQSTVIQKLHEAKFFIPILTPNSIDSKWLWFETGFFWSIHKGNNLFPLYKEIDEIPSPLNVKQGKSMNSGDELFDWLIVVMCQIFNIKNENTAILSELRKDLDFLK